MLNSKNNQSRFCLLNCRNYKIEDPRFLNPDFKSGKKSGETGFIALISSVIISAVLMAVVFSLSFAGFFTRFNLLDSEYKERSYELAHACFNVAAIKLASDASYIGNETLTIGTDTCQIRIITTLGTIETRAVMSVGGATTNLRGVLNPTNFIVMSLIELANF